jgi:outer membrane murein-binding lipoprotein Lpp
MQRTQRRIVVPFSVILVLLLAGCAAQNHNTVPTPAPIQVASDINKLAQVTNAAATSLRAALNQGKISQAEFNIAARVGIAISATGKKLNADLRSTDTWDVQKVKMRNDVIASGLAEIAKQLSPTARTIMAVCLSTFNAISTAVGGPVL